MEIIFIVGELVRLQGIINHWPITNLEGWALMERLLSMVKLTQSEESACGWHEAEVDGQRGFVFDGKLAVNGRMLNTRDCEALIAMASNPPPEVAWRFGEKALYDALIEKLRGGL